MSDVTQILSAIEDGDPSAAEQLLPLVYGELRKMAAAKMSHEAPGQTLDATGLVHEAYIRLMGAEGSQHWDSRGHFFAAAAEAMRRILVDNARRKRRPKHGGDLRRLELDELRLGADMPPDELLALDETLAELNEVDPRTAQLVKLHCFGGLTIEQAAEIAGLSTRTAYRDWSYARAWLFKAIQRKHRPVAD